MILEIVGYVAITVAGLFLVVWGGHEIRASIRSREDEAEGADVTRWHDEQARPDYDSSWLDELIYWKEERDK